MGTLGTCIPICFLVSGKHTTYPSIVMNDSYESYVESHTNVNEGWFELSSIYEFESRSNEIMYGSYEENSYCKQNKFSMFFPAYE